MTNNSVEHRSMKKALVTGASGFLGGHFVRRLVAEGYATSVLVRSKSEVAMFDGLGVATLYGDITDELAVLKAVESQDLIIHAAGVIEYHPTFRQLMEAVNVGGTKNVLAAMSSGQRLLHLSSVVAVGASFKPEVLNESSPYMLSKYNFGYSETKLAAEALVHESISRRNIWATMICPTTVYGPADAQKGSRKTQVKVARGKFPFLPPGGVGIVGVEDVVEGGMLALKNGQSGERYILNSENLLISDVFTIIAQEAGVAPPRWPLPKAVVYGVGLVGEALRGLKVSSSLPGFETARLACMYHWFSSDKARASLGFRPRPAREAIAASVQWMRKNGWLDESLK